MHLSNLHFCVECNKSDLQLGNLEGELDMVSNYPAVRSNYVVLQILGYVLTSPMFSTGYEFHLLLMWIPFVLWLKKDEATCYMNDVGTAAASDFFKR